MDLGTIAAVGDAIATIARIGALGLAGVVVTAWIACSMANLGERT